MTVSLPWLPSSALADTRTAAPVARALGEWCSAWLAAGDLYASARWEPFESGADSMGYRPTGREEAHRLLVREDATLELAGLLLGRPVDERECRTRHDRAVLEHLVEVAIAALSEQLAGALDRSANIEAEKEFVLTIAGAGGATLFRLEATGAVLVALAREWAGPPRRRPSLPARRSSLDAQLLTLSAQVGTSRLALADIEALGTGDVLALDTPLSALLTACIDGKPSGAASLSLASAGATLKLQIERPATQW